VVPLERATRLYLLTFSALIMLSSAETFVAALNGGDDHAPRAVLLGLCGLEVLAALGFLMRCARRFCGTLLAFVFIVAALLHALPAREVPVALLLDFATTLYLLQTTRAAREALSWA